MLVGTSIVTVEVMVFGISVVGDIVVCFVVGGVVVETSAAVRDVVFERSAVESVVVGTSAVGVTLVGTSANGGVVIGISDVGCTVTPVVGGMVPRIPVV